MKLYIKKFYITYLITLGVSLVVGFAIFFVYFKLNDSTMYAAINGTSFSAVVLLSVGGLMYVAGEGFFDVFSYGVKQVGSSIFGKKANENKDFAMYKEQKNTKRESAPRIFVPILISGAIILVVAILLRVLGTSI